MALKLKTSFIPFVAFVIALNFISCKKDEPAKITGPVVNPDVPVIPVAPGLSTIRTWLVDKNATEETAAMFYNLKELSKSKIMFGHQDDTFEGYNWSRDADRSDVKEVTGSYPAVYGWDFMNIASFQQNSWFEEYKRTIKDKTIEAHKRGGVNTFSWHYWNPVASIKNTAGNEGYNASFYYGSSPQSAVGKILPGASHHEIYKESLKQVANFAKTLQADGKLVPIIFRPFHELDGEWFWWGSTHCTADEYKEMYRFTVTYLRDVLQVHNFLFAWSPDNRFITEAQYLERYPGDDYVDVVGTDNYGDLKPGTDPVIASKKLKIVSDYGIKKNKVAAFTETGLANITQSNWYTQMLLKVLQAQKVELAYVLAWGNRTDTYYTPYKGHPAEADFINFKNSPYVIFGDKVPEIHKLKTSNSRVMATL